MYDRVKRLLAFVVGMAVLWGSMVFSEKGFSFKEGAGYSWVGWSLALAATVAEFMLNSNIKKVNWSIILLGVCGYTYSIYTNMLGFQSLREGELFNIINVIGAVFMDVFPEVAIAWALDESKVGDLVGNFVKTFQNPQDITDGADKQEFHRSYPPSIPRSDRLRTSRREYFDEADN